MLPPTRGRRRHQTPLAPPAVTRHFLSGCQPSSLPRRPRRQPAPPLLPPLPSAGAHPGQHNLTSVPSLAVGLYCCCGCQAALGALALAAAFCRWRWDDERARAPSRMLKSCGWDVKTTVTRGCVADIPGEVDGACTFCRGALRLGRVGAAVAAANNGVCCMRMRSTCRLCRLRPGCRSRELPDQAIPGLLYWTSGGSVATAAIQCPTACGRSDGVCSLLNGAGAAVCGTATLRSTRPSDLKHADRAARRAVGTGQPATTSQACQKVCH